MSGCGALAVGDRVRHVARFAHHYKVGTAEFGTVQGFAWHGDGEECCYGPNCVAVMVDGHVSTTYYDAADLVVVES